MSLNTTITNGFQATLNHLGENRFFFDSINNLQATFFIIQNIAQEWIYRHPDSQAQWKPLINSCNSINFFYATEIFAVPLSFFKERVVNDLDRKVFEKKLNELLKKEDSDRIPVDISPIVENYFDKKLGVEGTIKKIDKSYPALLGLLLKQENVEWLQKTTRQAFKETRPPLLDRASQSFSCAIAAVVATSCFLDQLKSWNLVDLAKWSRSVGKISGLHWVKDLNLTYVIVGGCLSLYALSTIDKLKNTYTAYKIDSNKHINISYYKPHLYSLANASIQFGYFGLVAFSLINKNFDQPSMMRAASVIRHFSSIISSN